MALFGNKKVKKTRRRTSSTDKISSATIITSCMQITGNLEGTDTIHIDGHVIGNISVNNTLVIGKSGMVEGEVEAKHIIVNGELQGKIKCENLEVMQTGKVSKQIEATKLVLDGTIDGEITGHTSIEVLENANIHTSSLKSKAIIVHGKVEGTVIATEILKIGSKGFVEGQITVKNIRTEEGGRMIGTMSTYQNDTNKTKAPKKVEETEKVKKPSPTKRAKESQEDDFFDKK